MTKKIPIGIQDFEKIVEGDYFYVDKTKIIYDIITSNGYYFLSRPRRFGKSLTLSVMKYLYLGKKELFKDTWIYNNWNFEETNPVLLMSFAGYTADQDIKEYIIKQFKVFLDEDEILTMKDFDNRFELDYILQKIYEKTGKQTVILIDEYDKGILVNLTKVDKAEEMRDFFTSFYAGVKDSDDKIKLFMLTGLTKVLKMSVFSVLNNLQDISFDPRFYNLMGYNSPELKKYFSEEIKDISLKQEKTYEEILENIRVIYNGYNFGNAKDTTYNPRNINNFISKKQLSFYWADTGIPSAILHYIDKNSIKVSEFITKLNQGMLRFEETEFKLEDLHNIKPEILFANAGYLTIKKYENNVYELAYPNKETESVMSKFLLKIAQPNYDFALMETIASGIYEGIINQDKEILEETFEKMLYEFLNETAYEWINKNPEGWFKTFLGLFLRLNNIYYYPEVENLKGRKDLVIPVNNKYYIVEAKVDKTTKEAIEQINKKYLPQFTDLKEIIKVGFNWNRKQGKVEIEFE